MKSLFLGIRGFAVAVLFLGCFAGCAALFGWNIHAPGRLSAVYYERVMPAPARLALALPEDFSNYVSTARGGRLADPMKFYVGEAFAPILIEAFQQGFQEFIFMEADPTPEIMSRYGIPHLVKIEITDFGNKVTLKGQAVEIKTRIILSDQNLNETAVFSASGTSDADKIFAKKGGPEVNLNSALENNATATVQVIQEYLQQNSESR